MPRYYFYLRDGTEMPDDTGTELPDDNAARSEAVIMLVVKEDVAKQICQLRFSANKEL